MLWGQNLNGTGPDAGDRQSTDFNLDAFTNDNCDRRRDYLKAATDLVVSDTEEMVAAWLEGGDARVDSDGKTDGEALTKSLLAFAMDLGLSSARFPARSGVCTIAQADCTSHFDGSDALGDGFELSDTIIGLVAGYVAGLGTQRQGDAGGTALFREVGCATCHKLQMQTDQGPVAVYSDLLLHDMGLGLADGIGVAGAKRMAHGPADRDGDLPVPFAAGWPGSDGRRRHRLARRRSRLVTRQVQMALPSGPGHAGYLCRKALTGSGDPLKNKLSTTRNWCLHQALEMVAPRQSGSGPVDMAFVVYVGSVVSVGSNTIR